MAAISRSQMLKELVPGLNALFGLEYKRYEDQYKDLVEVDSSERSFEEETKLAGFGAAQVKAEGTPIAYDTAQEAWTARYVHETIAYGFAITEEAIEDNLYASVSKRYTKALARSTHYTKEVKAASIFNNAFTAGAYAGGDGVALCATNHPLINGGTNSNTSSTNVDLNETGLEAAVIQIAGWTDERGLLIAAKPRKLILPVGLMFVQQRLLKSENRVGTMNNDINAVRSMGVFPEGYTVNNYLTNAKSWWIKTDVPGGPKMFQRVPLKTSMEGDFDTGNVRYKARERYSMGFTDPLGVWGSLG